MSDIATTIGAVNFLTEKVLWLVRGIHNAERRTGATMVLALTIALSAVAALAASLISLVVIFFSMTFWNQHCPSDKEATRRRAADLLQVRTDLTDDEKQFLADLRWKGPANRFFLAMPKIFGIIFVSVFAVCFYLL